MLVVASVFVKVVGFGTMPAGVETAVAVAMTVTAVVDVEG